MIEHLENNKENINIPQTGWLQILPDLKDKKILKLGTEREQNIMTMAIFGPKSIHCIGNGHIETKNSLIQKFNTLDEVAGEKFDLVILDEPNYLMSFDSFLDIKELLTNCFNLLQDEGLLLLCFPEEKTLSLKYRYWIRKILRNLTSASTFFLCMPSAELPLTIIPNTKKTKRLLKNLPDTNNRAYTIKQKIKKIIKNILFTITKLYNPLYGLILIAGKSSNPMTNNELLLDIAGTLTNNEKLIMTFMSRREKQFVFIYNELSCQLQLIVKIGFSFDRQASHVKEEYDNLKLLSECKQLFSDNNINIPEPIKFLTSAQKEISAQSVVSGSQDFLNLKNQKEALKILGELTKMQIFMQETCTKNIIKPVRWIDRDYLHNYMDLPLEWNIEDISINSKYIQHGDFAVINIHRDDEINKWGIIDWEWMAKGYPPLFDLFSLFNSIRFIDVKNVPENVIDKYYLSFIQTYFSINWFSNGLKSLIKHYCDYYQVDLCLVFRYFTAFLLLQCNKYRLFYKFAPYQNLYEKMLTYSLKHKKEFTLLLD